MTPHGQRPASRIDTDVIEDPARSPNVGPSTEVNALGQPLQVKSGLQHQLDYDIQKDTAMH